MNPENILWVYDSLNPKGRMVLKSDIISDLDSLSTLLFDEMQEKLFALKDSTTLRNALIGKWRLKSIERVNGIPFKLQSYENIQFSEQGEFILENINDTVRGRWNLVNARNGNLLYKYNKPQLAVKDKEILKLLSEEQIKSIAYNSGMMAIKIIDNDTLVFMTFIPQNTKNFDDTYYRLILTTYKRNE